MESAWHGGYRICYWSTASAFSGIMTVPLVYWTSKVTLGLVTILKELDNVLILKELDDNFNTGHTVEPLYGILSLLIIKSDADAGVR